ncbi:hypothetical protein ACFCY8_13295 [Streptomyces noursei]|uniref:hypothetical protein n=1 Tax=Streptomyces noursei TaxID=1971 RepID=UPI0035D986AA
MGAHQLPKLRRERYKKRNTVDGAINKLKQSRGYIYLGIATSAALVMWLRT